MEKISKLYILLFVIVISLSAQEIPQSLETCFRLALQNNVDIEVQLPLPLIAEEDIQFAQSPFDDYFLLGSFFYGKNDLELFQFRNGDFDIAVAKRFLTGTEVSVGYSLSYFDFELNDGDIEALIGDVDESFWNSSATIRVSQPLLRNFGVDVNSTQINLAKRQKKIAEYEVERQINDTLSQVEIAYWTWISLLQIKKTLEISIDKAEYYKKEVIRKAGIVEGVLPSDIDQSDVDIRRRRTLLINTNKRLKVWEDRLKRLIYPFDEKNPGMPSAGLPAGEDGIKSFLVSAKTENVTDERIPQPDYSLALKDRPELKQVKERIASTDILILQRENQLLPGVNVVARYSFTGDDEQFDDALGKTFDGDHSDWQVGVVIDYPLGNLGPKSQLRQAKSQRTLEEARERQLQYNICLQIREIHHAVVESVERYDNVSVSLRKSQDRLVGVERRYRNPLPGDFNLIFFVQDAEFQRTQAQINQHEATLQYKIAIAQWNQAHAYYIRNVYSKYRRP